MELYDKKDIFSWLIKMNKGMKNEDKLTCNSTMIARPLLAHSSFTTLVYSRISKWKSNTEKENPIISWWKCFNIEICGTQKYIFSKPLFYHCLWNISRNTHIRFAEIKPNNPKKALHVIPTEKSEVPNK